MKTLIRTNRRWIRPLIGLTAVLLALTGLGWAAEAPNQDRSGLLTEDQLRDRDRDQDRDQTRLHLQDALEQHLQTMERLRTQLREQDRDGVNAAIREGRQLAVQLRDRERAGTGNEGAVQEVRVALQRHADMLNRLRERVSTQENARVDEALRACTRAEEMAQLRIRTMEARQLREHATDDVVRPSDMRPGSGAQEGARRQMGPGERAPGGKGPNGAGGKR